MTSNRSHLPGRPTRRTVLAASAAVAGAAAMGAAPARADAAQPHRAHGTRGIALALALAAELSREHPVFFLGNTGHELNNHGVRAYLADEFDLEPRAVFHLGSALAAAAAGPDGRFELVPRGAASNPGFEEVPGLAADLAAARFSQAARFPGEGAVWNAVLGPSVPLLSLAGNFREFHSPDDTPWVTTSAHMLEQAYDAVRAAAHDLISAT
jgi:hypothetical protein